ncbi:MAG TPA: hypothetical protein IAD04_04165 [Candidatus Caccosoma faecigallinarum]|uniref:Uncharacterized protein n=1 Tax=Candidatus Caccosoma faecigallinarum TaxID=2840720 RepID=A0A9D1G8L1_9FIRM|nr:hypothetical protein [Candidatus Caccosoma faecigallinarum]
MQTLLRLDKLVYFTYNGTRYFYVFNAQNDITHLVDDTGTVVASYLYDAWGNHQVFDANGVENTNADFILRFAGDSMKKTSIRQLYWFTMICHIFALLCGIGGSIIMVVNYKEFIENFGKILGIIFLIGIVGLFVALIIFSIKVIITLLKDAKSLKSNDYVSIVGKVLKFKRNIEPESGVQINDRPIVLILDTGEEVELFINDKIMIGETYKFNYLKNCKIAEVVEKIQDL